MPLRFGVQTAFPSLLDGARLWPTLRTALRWLLLSTPLGRPLLSATLRPAFAAEAARLLLPTAARLPSLAAEASEAGAKTLHFVLVQKTIFIFVHHIEEAAHLFGNLGSTDFPILVLIVPHWVKAPFPFWPALPTESTLRSATLRPALAKSSTGRSHALPDIWISRSRGCIFTFIESVRIQIASVI